jgi:hypothetical protein
MVPQFAEAVGNVMFELVVDDSALAAAITVSNCWRAYEPPDTSVPPVPAGIVGIVVNKPRYVWVLEYATSRNEASSSLSARYVLMFATETS